ncbi:ECF transporter S component [Halobacillus litoralis]|uniref:ECF transporter S component n=1 Tax=Halobacillus litoralis TaxID=45668 RepID=UPI001CD1E2B9|nr:ECF transporter S component [Halobacillus litoralis]MCA0969552.1 ECF transporter S component [Halobacillus litoralis]
MNHLTKLQRMTTIGILSAISIILYYFKFPIPFFPPFLTLDISDVPALVGAITLGPAAGILIQFLKNIVDYISHGSYVGLPVGQIANFLSGSLIVGLIGAFYYVQKRLHIGSYLISVLLFLSAMYVLNYYFILPSIMGLMGIGEARYIEGFTKFNPLATDFPTAVLFVIIPFNLIKISLVYAIGVPFSLRLKRLVQPERKNIAA